MTRIATEMKHKPSLLAISDADWSEAVQREAVLRPLAQRKVKSKHQGQHQGLRM